jgi:hypothetical protein
LGIALFPWDLGKDIIFLNIYGLYSNKIVLWNKVFNSNWICQDLTIIGGDLNFNFDSLEIWGPVTYVDCLLGYFMRKMEEVGLVDIELSKLNSAWRNNKVGETWVAKRLYRFFIS